MNKVELAKLLVKHPTIRDFSESMSKAEIVRVLSEEINNLDEATSDLSLIHI